MKIKNKMFIIPMIIFVFLLFGTIDSKAGSLYLNNLEFEAQINQDGSMDVTEIWDISINSTNTLYKTFKKDLSKYSEITNVYVAQIDNGIEKALTKSEQWAYHAEKDTYYGTNNNDGDFEIGWGVGLDNSRATKSYKISYTVKNVITKYNDYAELYWQFIGKSFEISSKKIKGTILLPSNAQKPEDIKVWGHTEGLNGTIYATDTNKIEFEINDFSSGRYVEIRTLFPTDLIPSTSVSTDKIKNKDILENVIEEETKWANDANKKRDNTKMISNVVKIGYIIINCIFIYIFGKKIVKYHKKIKELSENKYKPTVELEYFRELPNENATPGEAYRVMNLYESEYTPTKFGKVFSAEILDLSLKGYIEVKQEKNEKNQEIINIYVLENQKDVLKDEEKQILEFIKKATDENNKVSIKELEKYIKNRATEIQKLLKENFQKTEEQLLKEKIIDEEGLKEYKKYNTYQTLYIVTIIFAICFTLFIFFVPLILFLINAIQCKKICKKINVLTQTGIDNKEQWNGLKKYMEDFSLLNEREIPELVIWEKYLVYATAFGIAEKVIKQLKIVYPNFEELSNGTTTYTNMNIIMNTNFSTSFTNAISSSISSTYSSGTGSGGGFSGGGGRWRTVGGGRRSEDRPVASLMSKWSN